MKKHIGVNISEFVYPNGVCSVDVDNIGHNGNLITKCIDITKRYAQGDTFFFGHYRVDGTNLTVEDQLRYAKEIPDYFQTNGRYEPLTETVQKKKKVKHYSGYLTVGSLPVNDETYNMLPKIFNYYLETIYFCPRIDWMTFKDDYQNYMAHGTRDYVLNGFTDFLFVYRDSGDFAVEFSQSLYDKGAVCEEVKRILDYENI